jgi:hypothetical protein
MIESPLIQELLAEQAQTYIFRVLAARFGPVPPPVVATLKSVSDTQKLDKLVDWAAVCPDLEAFRARLAS